MIDQRVNAKFYFDLSKLFQASVTSESNNHQGTRLLASYFAQNSARLNPELTGNKYETCSQCRLSGNWTIEDIPPVSKGMNKRQKQIVKLRKLKMRNSKQMNLLKKLLDRKNGYQKLTCKLCGFITKMPAVINSNSREISTDSNQQKRVVHDKITIPENRTTTSKKKKIKDKTAGLNPMYIRPKQESSGLKSGHQKNIFDKQKKLDKLSSMLKNSTVASEQSNTNKMQLLMQL